MVIGVLLGPPIDEFCALADAAAATIRLPTRILIFAHRMKKPSWNHGRVQMAYAASNLPSTSGASGRTVAFDVTQILDEVV